MLFNLDTVESYNRAKRDGLRNKNCLTWTGIRYAIPFKLQVSDVTENELGPSEFNSGENVFAIL